MRVLLHPIPEIGVPVVRAFTGIAPGTYELHRQREQEYERPDRSRFVAG